ncbi:hypothetical protein DPMN_165339 [Dreissena polymorpha]|uniref:Uncharacterized protein n=1 Tax=Dreissena polymorpha TaxID=45954 RepID=A0A9D4IWA7_DREPO|nr:hypothetical protein DPMN_165339 [Dreissena polymorpha]
MWHSRSNVSLCTLSLGQEAKAWMSLSITMRPQCLQGCPGAAVGTTGYVTGL